MLATSGLAIRLPSRRTHEHFNPNVHGARGLFAFTVFLFHVVNSGLSTFAPLSTPVGFFLTSTSEYGVELFFCISGYVIAGTLQRARNPMEFLGDRTIRIYPVLWVSILAIAALGMATRTHGFEDLTALGLLMELPANLLALPGILPLDNIHPAAWSLSYEMAFYLFCAASWGLRRRHGPAAYWLIGPIAAVLIACYPRGALLLAGVLVAEGWPRTGLVLRLTRHPLPLLLLFLLCWRMVQSLSAPHHIIDTTLFQWAGDARLPLALLAFTAAGLGFRGIVAGHGALGVLLRSRPLHYLGTISYSLYLWHPIVMSGIKAILLRGHVLQASGVWAQTLFFLVALPPSLAVAHASQRVLEQRFAAWMRRRLHHRPPMPQPAALDPIPQHRMESA